MFDISSPNQFSRSSISSPIIHGSLSTWGTMPTTSGNVCSVSGAPFAIPPNTKNHHVSFCHYVKIHPAIQYLENRPIVDLSYPLNLRCFDKQLLAQLALTPHINSIVLIGGPGQWEHRVTNPSGLTIRDILTGIYSLYSVCLTPTEVARMGSAHHQDPLFRVDSLRGASRFVGIRSSCEPEKWIVELR